MDWEGIVFSVNYFWRFAAHDEVPGMVVGQIKDVADLLQQRQ